MDHQSTIMCFYLRVWWRHVVDITRASQKITINQKRWKRGTIVGTRQQYGSKSSNETTHHQRLHLLIVMHKRFTKEEKSGVVKNMKHLKWMDEIVKDVAYIVEQKHQARNQFGTPGGAKSFLRGAQIFELCPIVLNYLQHIFPGGRKSRTNSFSENDKTKST